jgi:hypothetical protein
MMKLQTIELHEVLHKIADVGPFSGEWRNADLFLCALGFEPRALTVPQELAKKGFKCQMSIYLEYKGNNRANLLNLRSLSKFLKGFSGDLVQALPADDLSIASQLKTHVAILVKQKSGPAKVVFDVSAAASRVVMSVMKVLLENEVDLTILYAEAEKYYPTLEEYENLGKRTISEVAIEKGVEFVQGSPEFPGQHLDPLPNCLIIVPGFNMERTKAVLGTLDPTLITSPNESIVWLIGVPHLEENEWRYKALLAVNELDEKTAHFKVSTFEYKNFMLVLQRIWLERWRSNNITLSLLGSKLQTVGASLFCYLHPDIKLIMSAPKQYSAKHYSEGCRAIWQLPLGQTKQLRDTLDQVNQMVLEFT